MHGIFVSCFKLSLKCIFLSDIYPEINRIPTGVSLCIAPQLLYQEILFIYD